MCGRTIRNKKSPKDIDESSDTYDTVDWLVKNVPNNNGKAGIYGISYPGFYAANGAIDAHPAMKASSPQAPVSEWFIGDDFRHNGALFLAHAFRFFSAFGQDVRPSGEPGSPSVMPFKYGTPDGYEFYLTHGPAAELRREVLPRKDRVLEGADRQRHLQPVLAGAQSSGST